MAIQFDGATRRIILDSASVSASEIWSRWVDWFCNGTNSKWPVAFRQVGGDDLGGGLSIPPYYFLQNNWRIRPMEQSHTLIITGNLFVEGGGIPVVQTLGDFNVSIQYTVPVQAQGISTSGGAGITAQDKLDITTGVWNTLLADHQISGSAGKALGTASTGGVDLEALVAAVWNAAIANHQEGTAGKALADTTKGTASTPAEIATAIWSAPTTGNTTPGSFGEYVKKKLLSIASFIGLK